ncbi:uncharacterized protein LOC123311729 [Coccinella septempunctata]|uniref:uncharacterized protein LOC123311729 n=1 Tax=Coccinella septempunctata TaxID=41139 RepID=UPI001D0993F4|nr:uncharacterized protein LOC123311729 [Coccinella septempunctata]
MGNCLASIVAEIVMSELQEQALSGLSFRVPLFKRYVDDIFTILPHDKINDTVGVFNNFHPRLQFTVEIESNGSLAFLDVEVIRDGVSLITRWYNKPTFSGRVLNFYSHHPFSHKVNIINNMKSRALQLSHESFHSNVGTKKDQQYSNGK